MRQLPILWLRTGEIDGDVLLPVLRGNSADMADYPQTRSSQVTAYEGMDRFAVIAAAWQKAEAAVAEDERVIDVTVRDGSPVGGQLGAERNVVYEYVVESRV